ncbi:hypothetical protein [uncultured Tateyamaria sp.]|nr:hypothetical protein [uncultured Tateyamaria sp.]
MAAVENEEPLTPGAVLKMGELDVVVTAMDAPESATGKERHFDATLLAVKCLFAMIIGFGFILPPAALNDLGGAAAASDILDAGGSDLVLAAVSAAPMDWGQEDLVQLSTLETARGEVVYAIDMSGDMDHAGAQKFVGDDQRLVLVDFDEIVAALMTITRYLDVEVTEVTLDDGAFVVSANMPVEKEKRVQEQVTKEMPMLPPLVFENDHLNILREAVDAEIVGVWSGGDEYLLTEAGDRVRKYEMITEEVQFIEIVDAALGAIKFQVKGEEVTWKLNL